MSRALQNWETNQIGELDQLEAAHAALGGTKPGRRYTTTQLNHALIVAIAGQFQGYCRNLHSEAVAVLAAEIQDRTLRTIVQGGMTGNRALDRGNANEDAISKDFERIGLDLWATASQAHKWTSRRKTQLRLLLAWRNAIAHQDFDPSKLGERTEARLSDARAFRSACTGLARTFDGVVGKHLAAVTNAAPWP